MLLSCALLAAGFSESMAYAAVVGIADHLGDNIAAFVGVLQTRVAGEFGDEAAMDFFCACRYLRQLADSQAALQLLIAAGGPTERRAPLFETLLALAASESSGSNVGGTAESSATLHRRAEAQAACASVLGERSAVSGLLDLGGGVEQGATDPAASTADRATSASASTAISRGHEERNAIILESIYHAVEYMRSECGSLAYLHGPMEEFAEASIRMGRSGIEAVEAVRQLVELQPTRRRVDMVVLRASRLVGQGSLSPVAALMQVAERGGEGSSEVRSRVAAEMRRKLSYDSLPTSSEVPTSLRPVSAPPVTPVLPRNEDDEVASIMRQHGSLGSAAAAQHGSPAYQAGFLTGISSTSEGG